MADAEGEMLSHPLLNEALAYEALRENLEQDCWGRWVIIAGGQQVGADYETYDGASEVAKGMGLDPLDCYIRQVGVETVIISYAK